MTTAPFDPEAPARAARALLDLDDDTLRARLAPVFETWPALTCNGL